MKIFKLDFKDIKILLIEIYLISMSFFIIGIFFYYRIFMKRFEYSLEMLKLNLNLKYFILCSFFFLFHVFLICFILIKILKKNKAESLVFLYTKKISDIFIYHPLDYAVTKISPYIPYSGTLIINYCYFFRQNMFRLFLTKVLCFIFYFLPKIFMALLFVIEIIYYNKVKYFIMFILIFVIPYIYILFLTLSEKFYDNNMPTVEENIVVTPVGLPNAYGVFTKFNFKLKENTGYTQKDLPEIIDAWDVLFYILNLNAMIREFILNYGFYITLVTSSCYSLGFGYQLYYFVFL